MAEKVGFEPTVPFGITGFQDRLHKPLGHLSKISQNTIQLYQIRPLLSIILLRILIPEIRMVTV